MALGCTVDELGERMSYAEFCEWQEYFALEPWGTEADDVRFETQMRYFFAANFTGSKGPDRFLDWDPDETARLRQERQKGMSLDEKIRAHFGV